MDTLDKKDDATNVEKATGVEGAKGDATGVEGTESTGTEGTESTGENVKPDKPETTKGKSKGKATKEVDAENVVSVNPSWVKEVFDFNPTVDVLYGTNDEQAFTYEGDAKNHARFLDVKDVKTFKR